MDATFSAELERIRQEFRTKLTDCLSVGTKPETEQGFQQAATQLERVRTDTFGRKSALQKLLHNLGALPAEQRATNGDAVNRLKQELQHDFEEARTRAEEHTSAQQLQAERLDSTLPDSPRRVGTLHPTGQVIEETIAIFGDMGFRCAEGPDVEDDFHNFVALNFPPDHPARQMHDTFYLKAERKGEGREERKGEGKGERACESDTSQSDTSQTDSCESVISASVSSPWLLRTHTSPVQVRTMLQGTLPIRIIAPGRCYRSDSDQTHTPMFHQVEGLVVDEHTHFGHLKSCLSAFVHAFFERDRVAVRFRPSYFPFTEPSAEMDIACRRDKGSLTLLEEASEDCDWLEILGCGMVHPNVLHACKLDAERYQGFAFGMGIERLAMLKYGIADLRTMFEGDVEWLQHYGFSPLETPSLLRGLRV